MQIKQVNYSYAPWLPPLKMKRYTLVATFWLLRSRCIILFASADGQEHAAPIVVFFRKFDG